MLGARALSGPLAGALAAAGAAAAGDAAPCRLGPSSLPKGKGAAAALGTETEGDRARFAIPGGSANKVYERVMLAPGH